MVDQKGAPAVMTAITQLKDIVEESGQTG